MKSPPEPTPLGFDDNTNNLLRRYLRVVCAVCGAPLRQANPGTVSLAPSGPWIHVGGVPTTDHHDAEPELLPR